MTTDTGRATFPLAAFTNVNDWAPSQRDNPWLAEPDWFIDGENSTGLASDSNDGLTAVSPLLTKRQYSRRLGTGQVAVDQNITLMSGEADGDDGALYCDVAVAIPCFYATKTLVTQGTFSAVTQRAVPVAGSTGGSRATVTASGVDWSLYTDGSYQIENVTTGAFFGIFADNGSNTCQIETPITDVDPLVEPGDPGSFTVATSPDNTAGDTYKLWQLPTHTFSRLPISGAKNFVGVGFVDMVIQPSESDYYSIRYTGIQLVRCKTLGYWSPISPGNCPMYVIGSRLAGLGFEMGNGALIGGTNLCTPYNLGSTVALTGGVNMVLAAGSYNAGGTWHVADAFLVGNLATNIVPGGAFASPTGTGTIIVSSYAFLGSLGAAWGTGAIQAHAGNQVLFGTSAASAFRNSGGISADAGAQCVALSSGAVSTLRNLTVANLDAAVGSGGFGSNAQSLKGTRFSLIA